MKNYAGYVEEGLLKNLESPFDEVIEQSIIGSDSFIDRIKREYLLNRSGDKNKEHSLIHLQQSFSFDEVIDRVSATLDVAPEKILNRSHGYREACRIGMHCVCEYCSTTKALQKWQDILVLV